MPRALLLALVSALLALGLLAGCGDDGDKGDDKAELKEAFDKDYPPINDEFVALGNETGETIKTAKDKSNAELATRFESLATRVDGLKRRLDALEPPPEYEADTKRLSAVMGVVSGDLKEISQPPRPATPRRRAPRSRSWRATRSRCARRAARSRARPARRSS